MAENDGTARGSWATAHRPRSWDEVRGQGAAVALARNIARGTRDDADSTLTLLHGPHGTGKTTIARLMMDEWECTDIVEQDSGMAADSNTIEGLLERCRYASENNRIGIILDECHRLTPTATEAIISLLPLRRWSRWVLATTDPQALHHQLGDCGTRVGLAAISEQEIAARLGEIATAEGLRIDPREINELAKLARGGMRDGISLMDGATQRVRAGAKWPEAIAGVVATTEATLADEALDAAWRGDHRDVSESLERLHDRTNDVTRTARSLRSGSHRLLRQRLASGSDDEVKRAQRWRRRLDSLAKATRNIGATRGESEPWRRLTDYTLATLDAPEPKPPYERTQLNWWWIDSTGHGDQGAGRLTGTDDAAKECLRLLAELPKVPTAKEAVAEFWRERFERRPPGIALTADSPFHADAKWRNGGERHGGKQHCAEE